MNKRTTMKHHPMTEVMLDEDDIEKYASLTDMIDDVVNPKEAPGEEVKTGFCLVIFKYTDSPGNCHMLTNTQPVGAMAHMFRTLAEKIERHLKSGHA